MNDPQSTPRDPGDDDSRPDASLPETSSTPEATTSDRPVPIPQAQDEFAAVSSDVIDADVTDADVIVSDVVTEPATSDVATSDVALSAPQTPAAAPSRDFTVTATIVAFAIGCAIALAAYVTINKGTLRGAAEPKSYAASTMNIPRGTSRVEGNTLIAQAPAGDVLVVATKTDFLARQLSAVSWEVIDVPAGADVRLLFSSDYTPKRVHNRPLVVEDGRVQPITLAGDSEWLGRITGLAIAVRAPGATIRVRGVTAKSLNAGQLLRDRVDEWFRFEPWSGTSINNVTGGSAAQSLPLPVAVVIAALLALAALALGRRFFPARLPRSVASIAALLFVLAWTVLDARWTVNLARQSAETFQRYVGKDAGERSLAAEDGELYAFLEKAKAVLPADPQRVVVLAAAHFYRGRAGWHLLPHRVVWEPARDLAPPAGMLHAGDYVVVWQRPGARFDAANGRLRFDNGVELPAKLLLGDGGSAVFAIL